METFDLEDFKYNFVNITAFRLVDAEDVGVRRVLDDMARFAAEQPGNGDADAKDGADARNRSVAVREGAIQAVPALLYDAVHVLALGLRALEQSHALRPAPGNVSCETEVPWDAGLSLLNYLNSVELKGLSGPIEFKEGRRVQFKLDLLKLKQHALAKVGEWTPAGGVNISDRAAFFDAGNINVTLVVITILASILNSLRMFRRLSYSNT